MDYLYFLRERTRFIRRFYTDAAGPFIERRRKIENSEPPFDAAPAFEADEPPFLDEWMDASDCLDVLGQSCISMLATSLHLYIQEWVSELVARATEKQLREHGIGLSTDATYKAAFKRGWITGYRAYCAALGVDWSDAPSDLALLEEIVLARNSVQHATEITSVRAREGAKKPVKHPGFFADPLELAMFSQLRHSESLRPVRLNITQEKLFAAIDEVEQFCDWLDGQHPMRVSASGTG